MAADAWDLQPIAENLSGALIALDFDGTLAPIVRDPATSRPVAGVIDTLAALAGAGSQIAIVTGRDARTVLELGGLASIPDVWISGLHGAESWHQGVLSTIDEPAGLAELRALLPAQLPVGTWLEDKRLSLVVHTRQAGDPERALDEVSRQLPSLVSEYGLEAHPGKLVLEIRIPGLSKATALERLLTEDTSAALFAGDDLGDLPAFEAVRAWRESAGRPGCRIAVGEVAELRAVADLRLDSPAELARLLQALRRDG